MSTGNRAASAGLAAAQPINRVCMPGQDHRQVIAFRCTAAKGLTDLFASTAG